MAQMNPSVGENNRLGISGGKKRLVSPFIRQEFLKCIGCIILIVTYGKKVHTLWGGIQYLFVRRHELNYTEIYVGIQI